MDILLVHFSGQRGGTHGAGSQAQHRRVALFEAVDLRSVYLAASQLTLLVDECAVVTLTGIDVHQFKAQGVIFGLRRHGCFQQIGRVVEATTREAQIDFGQ